MLLYYPNHLDIFKKHIHNADFLSISNEKYNVYLKEIAEIIGIEKNLTTHVGRKTFGFMALNVWNLPIETVSLMLGTFQYKNDSTALC